MHGSLKDYLKSLKTGKLPNPQLLLYQQQQQQQAPPIDSPTTPPPTTVTTNFQIANGSALGASAFGMTSSAHPATNRQSTLSLCPYHYNQLTQHNHNGAPPYMSSSAPTGGVPGNQHHHHSCPGGAQATEESISLYNVDPASKAHAMRLLRLLNSEYGLQGLADNHESCHDDTEGEAAIKLGQSAYSYNGLSEMCVRRACLDDYPYWYHGTRPRNDYYNYSHSYYNYSEQDRKERESSESPFAETPGTNAPLLPLQPPPIYINTYEGEWEANSSSYPQQECLCHHQLAPNLNPYHSYNLSTASGCVYCCQCANSEAVGGPQHPGDQANLGGAGLNVTASSASFFTDDTETRLSYFEVLDFALQIARGMEHLEKMKVSSIMVK